MVGHSGELPSKQVILQLLQWSLDDQALLYDGGIIALVFEQLPTHIEYGVLRSILDL